MAANVEKLHLRAPLDGNVDAVTDGKVFGWAWDRDRPGDRLEVSVSHGGALMVKGLADQPRADLAGSGIGDGAHAFALDLPEGTPETGLSVMVRSPATGAETSLPWRPAPQTVPEELQRVTASVHSLQQVQKQTASAVLGVLREIRQNRPGDGLEPMIAEITAGQQALMKRFESIEVFLLRFDTLLRQFDEKLSAAPPPDRGSLWRHVVVAAALLAVAGGTAALMI